MSESASITISGGQLHGGENANGHTGTFTAEAPANDAGPATTGHAGAGVSSPEPQKSNERVVHLVPGEEVCLVIGPAPSDTTAPRQEEPASTKPAGTKLHKPIDLIVANTAHTAGIAMQSFARLTGTPAAECDETFATEIARKMLCEIAHDASPTKVLFALGAIGGPDSLADVAQRLQAARDAAAA